MKQLIVVTGECRGPMLELGMWSMSHVVGPSGETDLIFNLSDTNSCRTEWDSTSSPPVHKLGHKHNKEQEYESIIHEYFPHADVRWNDGVKDLEFYFDNKPEDIEWWWWYSSFSSYIQKHRIYQVPELMSYDRITRARPDMILEAQGYKTAVQDKCYTWNWQMDQEKPTVHVQAITCKDGVNWVPEGIGTDWWWIMNGPAGKKLHQTWSFDTWAKANRAHWNEWRIDYKRGSAKVEMQWPLHWQQVGVDYKEKYPGGFDHVGLTYWPEFRLQKVIETDTHSPMLNGKYQTLKSNWGEKLPEKLRKNISLEESIDG